MIEQLKGLVGISGGGVSSRDAGTYQGSGSGSGSSIAHTVVGPWRMSSSGSASHGVLPSSSDMFTSGWKYSGGAIRELASTEHIPEFEANRFGNVCAPTIETHPVTTRNAANVRDVRKQFVMWFRRDMGPNRCEVLSTEVVNSTSWCDTIQDNQP